MTTKYDRTREDRAKIILSREHAVTKVSTGVFTVQSQTGIGSYRVDAHPDQCLFHQALQRSQINKEIHYNALSRTLLDPEMTTLIYKKIRKQSH